VKRRLGVAVWACAALLTVAAAGRQAHAASTSPLCSAADLRLSLVRSHSAATVTYWDLVLRNSGPKTCRLRGYPTVHLLGPHGAPLPIRIARVIGVPVRIVTVPPGHRAYFTVVYVPGRRCGQDRHYAYGLTAVPPGSVRALVIHRHRYAICAASAGGRPDVYPLRPRLGGH
jgi:hypothetical protein